MALVFVGGLIMGLFAALAYDPSPEKSQETDCPAFEPQLVQQSPKKLRGWYLCENKWCKQPSPILSMGPYAGKFGFRFKTELPFEEISKANPDRNFVFLLEKINRNTLVNQANSLENIEFLVDLRTSQLVYEYHTEGRTVFLKSPPTDFGTGWHDVNIFWGEEMALYLDGELIGKAEEKGFMKPGTDTCIFLGSNRDCEKQLVGEIRGLTVGVEKWGQELGLQS